MLENLKIAIWKPTILSIKDLAKWNVIKWKYSRPNSNDTSKEDIVIEDRVVTWIDCKSVWVKWNSKFWEEHWAEISKVKLVNPNLKTVTLTKVEKIELRQISYNWDNYYRIDYTFNNGASDIICKGIPFTIYWSLYWPYKSSKNVVNQWLINIINSSPSVKLDFETDEKNLYITKIFLNKKSRK